MEPGPDLESSRRKARAFDEMSELVSAIVAAAQPGDHILVMSNGGFGGVHGKILGAL